jgi:tetratricopeptide (TPR) repeat protein
VSRCLYYARRFEEATDLCRIHLEGNPTSLQGYVSLYRALKVQGMLDAALLELERGISVIGRVPILLAFAGYAHARVGRRDQALALLAELRRLAERRHVPPAYQAEILFGLDDLDAAFGEWNRAAEQRSGWLAFTRADPAWDPLRSDPRLVALMRGAGLAPPRL